MKLSIVGIRGVPASHGGFETFAERLAPYLVGLGWDVTVYCQGSASGKVSEDSWRGVRRVHIPVKMAGAAGTVEFDWRCISDTLKQRPDVVLTLGYNTAVFTARLKVHRVANVINMDGVEWRRAKWSRLARYWFRANEFAAMRLGSELIADHPAIADHLVSRHGFASRISMIPYGGDPIEDADISLLSGIGVKTDSFFSVVARPEPENSVLEIVAGFSRRRRECSLLILGAYDCANEYHMRVRQAASDQVIFAGAVYDRDVLRAVRWGSRCYIHGHTVGGTNPSLVEALAAGSAVIAHDNVYNRWVAGDAANYFDSVAAIDDAIAEMDGCAALAKLKGNAARLRYHEQFQWANVLEDYSDLLQKYTGASA